MPVSSFRSNLAEISRLARFVHTGLDAHVQRVSIMVLMSDFLTIAAVLAAVAAAFWSSRCALSSSQWRKRLTELADQIAVLEDSVEVMRGLAARRGARQVKRDQRGTDGHPDPKTQPDEWLKWKQSELAHNRKH